MFLLSTAESHQNESAVKGSAVLVERAQAGDDLAFAELYKTFSPMVHGIILARVRRDEVDDIVQEVFVSAFERLDSLRDPAAFGGWLVVIARNHAARFYRRERPSEELCESLSETMTATNEATEIMAEIRRLPETYRETLIMRLVEGMTGPEIAEQTGMTPDSVRVNLHRGMKLLKEKLGLAEKGRAGGARS